MDDGVYFDRGAAPRMRLETGAVDVLETLGTPMSPGSWNQQVANTGGVTWSGTASRANYSSASALLAEPRTLGVLPGTPDTEY